MAGQLNKARLNDTPIGVVFNAYNPKTGDGALFGNDTARDGRFDGQVEPITADALASSCWLSLYGFEGLPNGLMDGAYQRSCIIAELHRFDTIFAVRPLAEGWRGKVPANWFDVQDWQFEMWFSASYKAERADMDRINKLIDRNLLKDTNYKKITIIPVDVETPAGYFNYFSERAQVFDTAYEKARAQLKTYKDLLRGSPVSEF